MSSEQQSPPEWSDALLSRPSRRVTVTTFILIAFASMLLRLGGIGWGLPSELHHNSLHPDEPILVAAESAPYFKPGFYNYGSLYTSVQKLICDAGRTYGWIPKPNEGKPWEEERGVVLTGRVLSAAAGSLACAFLFLAALEIVGLAGAIAAAFLLSIGPGFVVHSRFQTTDVFVTLLVTIALWLVLRVARSEKPSLRLVMATGAFCGLAAGTKYTGVLLLLSLWSALFITDRKGFWKSLLAGTCAAAAAFFVATPGALIDSAKFWKDFRYELSHTATGHGLVFVNTPSGFLYHIGSLVAAYGGVALFASACGLTLGGAKRVKWLIPVGIFAIAYYISIGRAEVKFMRYVFPLLPCLALGAAVLVDELHRRGMIWRIANALLILVAGISMTSPMGAVGMTMLMVDEDPREQAGKWLLERIRSGSSLGFVSDPWFYSPTVYPGTNAFFDPKTGLVGADARLAAMRAASDRLIRVGEVGEQRSDYNLELLALAPDYIVISSFEFLDHDRVRDPAYMRFMPELLKGYELTTIFWADAPATRPEGPVQGGVKEEWTRVRSAFWSRYPTTPHDLMYIRPAICVFQKKGN